jgi:ribonucleoside-diphosphate reductase alpha chain
LNAGRARGGELVSCFLLEVNDSLNDISKAMDLSMQLSKIGGGVGLNLSKIRAKGEPIKGIMNATKGVVGVMKLLDNAFRYADQMGQRQGSGAAYLNIFHADINDFLDTKKIQGDDDIRVKTLSIGVVVPDKFVQLAREDKEMFVFYPYSVYKEYGVHLDEMDITAMYEELVDNPKIRKDRINARKLLEKLASMRYESGYPYIMFQDNVNREHALNNISRVKFSNLCSEILQVSQVSEYKDYGIEDNIGMDISCNLGSINIANVMENKSIERAVKLGMDALTTVSRKTDITNAPAVANANRKMRSVGLGAMNLHGYLAKNKIQYQSAIGREFANTFFMMMNYYSIVRSMEIAVETGEKFFGFEESSKECTSQRKRTGLPFVTK